MSSVKAHRPSWDEGGSASEHGGRGRECLGGLGSNALQPREARGYSLLGTVRALQERLDDAEAAFVHALALAPGAQFT